MSFKKILGGVFAVSILTIGIFSQLRHKTPAIEGTQNKIKVGISQIVTHPVIDEVRAGIIDGFAAEGYKAGNNIVFDVQNAQGEASINQSIAQKFAGSNYDIFVSLGTQSSQALANTIKDRPVIFAGVTDPKTAGLVDSNEHPGGNITGTSDITLYKEQLSLLKQLVPSVKKVGIVYNPGEANARYALEQAKNKGAELGLEIIISPAGNGSEVLNAATAIADRVDAFYMLPESTVLAAQEALIKVAIEKKKPLIAIDQSGVEKGALATLGTNYRQLGERTAAIAIRVLNGENPGNIPVLGITDADLFFNTTTAKAIGINIPVTLINKSKRLYN